MEQFQGICIYPGIVIAETLWLKQSSDISTEFLGTATEIQNLETALLTSQKQIEKIRDWTQVEIGAQEADIFEAHLLMLTDPEYLDQIRSEITQNQKNAAQAIQIVTQQFIDLLSQASSDYLRERIADLKDISQRFIRNLSRRHDETENNQPCILIAEDLSPSDLMAHVSSHSVRGVALFKGGATSHTAILLRSMGIPSVFGLGELKLPTGTVEAVLDSESSRLVLDPDSNTKYEYQKKVAALEKNQKELLEWRTRPTELKDSSKILMVANVASQKAIEQALEHGAEGVGLLRTEFLFMDRRRAPSEDEQFEIYKRAILTLNGKPLVIRTLDIGGDKSISYLNMPKEDNPFLGVRGLRLCLKNPEIFLTQMRALARASEFGPLDVMFPMVTLPSELIQAFQIIPKTDRIRWGMMLEIPSNIFMIPEFSKHMSFFSIGSNDLCQYLTACDRMNANLQHLSDPYSPGVLRALSYLAQQVRVHNRELSVCGEIASDPLLIPFLAGIGVQKLSQNSLLIAQNRKLVSQFSLQDCQQLAQKITGLSDRDSIRSELQKFLQ